MNYFVLSYFVVVIAAIAAGSAGPVPIIFTIYLPNTELCSAEEIYLTIVTSQAIGVTTTLRI